MSVIDSLGYALAAKDSLLHLVASRPVSVTVTPTRDWLDFMNPAISMAAAIVGAVVGGVVTGRVTLKVQRDAHEQARRDDKAKLKHVIGTLLDRLLAASIILGENDGMREITISTLADIEGTMGRFDRVGENMFLLRDQKFVDTLEAFLASTKSVIGTARSAESLIEAQFKDMPPQPDLNSSDFVRWRNTSKAMRVPLLEAFRRWQSAATNLKIALQEQ